MRALIAKTSKFIFQIKHSKGQALLTAVIFFLFISLSVVLSLAFLGSTGSKNAFRLSESKKSYFLAEGGSEDVTYRVLRGKNYSTQEVIGLDGFFATTTTVNISGNVETTSIGEVSKNVRKLKTQLSNDIGTSFHYGVQVGDGGLIMQNSALVTGNVYVNGPIRAFNSNEIKGDAVSAGPTGSITGVYATGTAYAYSIADSKIDGDAYYYNQNISNTVVKGTSYPNSPDQPPLDLPISDEIISNWETSASSTLIITSPCPYVIKTDTTIGPTKIICNLEIEGSPIITVSGPIWVAGNIIIKNTAIIRVDSSLGKKSVPIIADNPANRLTSSKIELQNSVVFQNSGAEGSYILMISQNNSAESGGSEKAIIIKNTVSGDLLLYAGHGEIYLDNRSDLREVTGYAVNLSNQANIIYQTGLASLLFESGPAGSFSVGSWREIK